MNIKTHNFDFDNVKNCMINCISFLQSNVFDTEILSYL